jgi:hypothetical protein
MMKVRRGMALAVTVGIVALIAILAVATLSLAGRLMQASTLGLRDTHLDAGTAFGLSAVTDQWRQRHIGRLAVGASTSFDATPSGMPVSVSAIVTRVSAELFWVVAESRVQGGVSRRENLVVRTRVPDLASLPGDSANVTTLGFVVIDSLAATADVELPAGSIVLPTDGVVHVLGDATLAGGAGSGVLIVEGRLTVSGPVLYEGVIIARGGISTVVPGVTVRGVIRAAGSPSVEGNFSLIESAAVVQNVLLQVVMPKPVEGRRWGEMY